MSTNMNTSESSSPAGARPARRLRKTCLCVATAFVLLRWFVTGATCAEDESTGSVVHERIEARAFLVKDATGYLWGVLGMDARAEPEPALLLNPPGESGLIVATLDAESTPRHVAFHLYAKKQFIEFGNNGKWGSFLHLADSAGQLRLGFSTRAQTALDGEAATWGDDPWPVVCVRNANGEIRSLFVATPEGGHCEVFDDRNRSVFRHGARARDVRDAATSTPAAPTVPANRRNSQADIPPRIGTWDYNTYGGAQTQHQQRQQRK